MPSTKDLQVDILIIGGGPGGYTAAIRAAQLGFSVALAEGAELGGVCLNWGCIPTKSLLHTADVLREIHSANELGIEVGKPAINLEKVVGRSREVAAQLSSGVEFLMRKNGVNVIRGEATFLDNSSVVVDGTTVTAGNIIVATGARSKQLPGVSIDGNRIWDAKAAMTPSVMPKSLLIVGGGAIGVEFASLYQTLGSKVTLVEVLDQILPTEDAEIAQLARVAFEKEGIEVKTGSSVESIVAKTKYLEASIDGKARRFDAVLLSVGVTGNVESLGLEQAGVDCKRGFIKIDGSRQTTASSIYAIGDVTGAPCLAHKASHDAVIAVETIAGLRTHPVDSALVPGCIYSHPQIASIGLSEEEALKKCDVRIGRFPFIGNGKAIAINEPEGLIKTIFDKTTGALIGAHMIGAGVTELIHGFSIAMGLETTEAELMATIFPHPTLSEAMHESVLSAFDRAINL
jgi:dihydrolipoamide dehydrogenase